MCLERAPPQILPSNVLRMNEGRKVSVCFAVDDDEDEEGEEKEKEEKEEGVGGGKE